MKTSLLWDLRYRHVNRLQLAAGVYVYEVGQKAS